MTRDDRRSASLRTRMLAAFTAVTAAAVALVAVAAFIGTDRGLTTQEDAARRSVTHELAASASAAWTAAGAWDGADLRTTRSLAVAAGASVVVLDTAGTAVPGTTGMGGNGMGGNGMGSGGPDGSGRRQAAGGWSDPPLTERVDAAGRTVGTVVVRFAEGSAVGRPVAWAWVAAAAVAALLLALLAAVWITRQLTRPLAGLTAVTRAFAAGDRSARVGGRYPGEFGVLATAFDEAATRVQVSEEARRRLSADVAHELRTPLAALQAGLEELRDGLAPADPAALARLHDQSLRIGRVVGDLADLSAADASRLTIHRVPTDLSGVVAEAVRSFDAHLRSAGLDVTTAITPGLTVAGDAERLHQVVGNLLRNCARHCRPGDAVTVSLARDAGDAVLTVADTGPGIAPGDLPHVLDRFWRRGAGAGSGLGLAVVAGLVEAHAGRVEVTSDGAAGTTVRVTLPAG